MNLLQRLSSISKLLASGNHQKSDATCETVLITSYLEATNRTMISQVTGPSIFNGTV